MKVMRRAHRGFSLIELIVGLVVMSIALTFLTTLFFSNPSRSVEPLLQIRAAQFGSALMDEILSKKFDELTPEGGLPACTACSALLGSDGESRDSYDDVDDYNDSCGARIPLTDALGSSPANYNNYEMEVCVFYDDNYDGVDDGATGNTAKLITINIYLPPGSGLSVPLTFSAYKGNY